LLTLDHILFAIYLLLGPCLWATLVVLLLIGHERMNRLQAAVIAPPEPAPLVSIVVPAKDEAERIEACLTAALAQTYANFEIVSVDDRSTDGTSAILDRLAANSSRLTALHVLPGELPEGWAGKTNALNLAVPKAKGDWLLFLDADVAVNPDLVSRMIGLAAARSYDAVSLLTGLHCNSMLQKAVLPAAAGAWGMMHLVSVTNNDNLKNFAIANGQVFLIRRTAYESVGGHAAVRFELAEDVQLMRRLKSAGFRTRLFHGDKLATTQMYGTTRQAIRGWARIYATTDCLRTGAIVAATAILAVSSLTFWPGIVWGIAGMRWEWIAGAAAQTAAMGAWLAFIYRWSGNARRYAAVAPATFLFIFGILLYALSLCRTGNISWRGTQYTFRKPDAAKPN
jgi:cellulose synthase/poly-beta-1,6-N-acetylglucosamine synthase-like glycosyltransferase